MSQYSRPAATENWGYHRPPDMKDILASRILAFFIDAILISITVSVIMLVLSRIFIVIGLATPGWGWFFIPQIFWLMALVYPLFWITALLYNGILISGSARATIGMRLTGIQLERMDGAALSFTAAAVHAILFYISVTVFTFLILLVGLARDDRRLVHDLLTGTIAVRAYRGP